jgi:hypothetical protein
MIMGQEVDEQRDVKKRYQGGDGDHRGCEVAVHIFQIGKDEGIEPHRQGGANYHRGAGNVVQATEHLDGEPAFLLNGD